jgi:hypothetical protein
LLSLASKENSGNVREARLMFPDGTEDTFPYGVPRGWLQYESIPSFGKFSCRYLCAPENRRYETRRQNAEKFGNYKVDAKESEVMWWTGLMEVPVEVISAMAIIMAKYGSPEQAFSDIDGLKGNGLISMGELTKWLAKDDFVSRRLARSSFVSQEKSDMTNRISDDREPGVVLFRYLDRSGEGTISKQEWSLLNQVWREFDCCARELVAFLVLAFGSNFNDYWQILDTSGDNQVDMQEWLNAVEDIGYFGPAHVVFDMLDHSGDGIISNEEFESLRKYLPQKRSVGRARLGAPVTDPLQTKEAEPPPPG